jgi:hypothetical protein
MSSPLAASIIDHVQCVAFAVSLLPGQAEAHRVALASCWAGARKEAYQGARRRAGIIREAAWIQPGPGGDAAVVYHGRLAGGLVRPSRQSANRDLADAVVDAQGRAQVVPALVGVCTGEPGELRFGLQRRGLQ